MTRSLLFQFRRAPIMLAGLVLIVVLSQSTIVQAQSCVAAPGGKYVMVSQGFRGSPIAAYSDAACASRSGTVGVGSDGWVYTTLGQSVAAGICLSNNRGRGLIIVDALGGGFYKCTATGESEGEEEAPRFVRRPTTSGGYVLVKVDDLIAPELDLTLDGLRITAFDGMNSGIQFRRLGAWHVGNQAVLDMGLLDAVDIWSQIGSGYEICFPQYGRVFLLDAATSPRSLVSVEHRHTHDGYTCASHNRAGTLVLVSLVDGETVEQTAPATETTDTTNTVIRLGTEDSIDTAILLDACAVKTLANMRLRRRPWERIRDVIPRDTVVPAIARTEHWFKVEYDEIAGWVAAWLVSAEGDCAWENAAE